MATTPPHPTPESNPTQPAAIPDSGDQDIDTAGTEADDTMTALGPSARPGGSPKRPSPSYADAPDNEGPPKGALDPSSLHRREDDEEAFAASPEFHDRPGSGAQRR